MITKGSKRVDLENIRGYRAVYNYVYSNLKSMPMGKDKRNVASNLAYLYLYTDGAFDLDKITPTLRSFEGVFYAKTFEQKNSQSWMGQYRSSLNANNQFSQNRILVKNTLGDETLHTTTHETIHLASNAIVKEGENYILPNGLYDKYSMVDEIMTEYFANRVCDMRNHTLFAKSAPYKECRYPLYDSNTLYFRSESDGYSNISCFAPIFDAILHDEIINDKFAQKNDLLPYDTMLSKINYQLDKTLLRPDTQNYKELISNIEDLCVYTLINKTKVYYGVDESKQQGLLNDYIPLRQALMNYGVVDLQQESINTLDDLVGNILLGPNYDKEKLTSTLNSLCENNDCSFESFKAGMEVDILEYTYSVEKKSKAISKENSFDRILYTSNDDLIKLVNNEDNKLMKMAMKIKLGLVTESDEDEIVKYLKDDSAVDKDGRNLSYMLSNCNQISASFLFKIMSGVTNEYTENDKFMKAFCEKDIYGRNSFDYSLERNNTIFSANVISVLSYMAFYNDKLDDVVGDFYKQEESSIKTYTDSFFSSLLYSSKFALDGNFRKSAYLLNSSIDDFNKITDSTGKNFFAYCTDAKFSIDTFGADKFLSDNDIEVEGIRALLSNGFSYEDCDKKGIRTFDIFLDKLKKENDKDLNDVVTTDVVREICVNDGSWDDLIKGTDIKKLVDKYSFLRFDIMEKDIGDGESLYQKIMKNDEVGYFKQLEDSLKRCERLATMYEDSVYCNSSKIFAYLNKNYPGLRDDNLNKKMTAIALNEGNTDVLRSIMESNPEFIFKKNKDGSCLFETYAKIASYSDDECSALNMVGNSTDGKYIKNMMKKYHLDGDVFDTLIQRMDNIRDKTVDIDSPKYSDLIKNESIAKEYSEEVLKIVDNFKEKSFKDKIKDELIIIH